MPRLTSGAGRRHRLDQDREPARRWPDAHVTFDRVTDVTPRCPRCDGLLTRTLGPGVLCTTCGRVWVVREMLDRESGFDRAFQGAA
jgi:hypothetical protein